MRKANEAHCSCRAAPLSSSVVARLQDGDEDSADKDLHRCGFRYRLASTFWQPCSAEAPCCSEEAGEQVREEDEGPRLACAFDDALPPHLLAALQRALSPDSAFWTEHGYPAPVFFSYNVPLLPAIRGSHG